MDRLFGSMKLKGKFAVLGILLAVALAMVTVLLVKTLSEGIAIARSELKGIEMH